MKEKFLLKVGVLFLVIALVIPVVAIGCKEAAPTPTPTPTPAKPTPTPEVIEWRLQAVWPAGAIYGVLKGDFCPEVERRSGGRLKIRPYSAGGLVKPTEAFKAVSSGVVEVVHSIGTYNRALVQVGDVERGLPGSWRNIDEAYENFFVFRDGELFKILREAYRKQGNVRLWVHPTSSLALMTNFPMNSFDDLKGKKIITTSRPTAGFMKKYGGETVPLSAAEQYTALQRGTADGVVTCIYLLEGYKLHEVLDYVIMPAFQPTGTLWVDMVVNLDAWNKLPTDLKKIFEEVANDVLVSRESMWVKQFISVDRVVLQEKCSKWGVTVIELGEKEMEPFYNYMPTLWGETAARGEYCAKTVANIRAYLKSKGYEAPE